jgi:hypothetical protein
VSGAQVEPTLEQLLALKAWLTAYGRSGWKARLLAAWECSGRGYGAYGPELQQLRNGFGPTWLVKMTEPKLSAAITKLAPPPAPIARAVLDQSPEGIDSPANYYAPPAISGAALSVDNFDLEPELGATFEAGELVAAATPARVKFELVIRASLNLLDEQSLTAEQRAIADEIYDLCNRLEYTFEAVPS